MFIIKLLRLIIVFTILYLPLLNAAQNTVTLSPQEQAWLQSHPKITVGGSPDWAPFNFVDSNGEYSGIANDYLNLISKKTGLQFNVSIDRWSHNLQKIKDQKIDLLPAVYFTEERNQYLLYSSPYFEMLDYFFIRNDLDIKILADLDGKRIAIPQDYAHETFLREHFPNIEIITVNTFTDAIEAVLENRADMLYDTYGSLTYTFKKEGINTIIPFKSTRKLGKNSIHFVTHKNMPILSDIINKGLNAISPEEKKAIYARWLSSKTLTEKTSLLVFTQEEKQWLKANPIIQYGAEKDWAPYDFVNAQDQHIGLARDILIEVSKLTGIQFEAEINDWPVLLEKTQNGELDLLPAIYFSEKRQQKLVFTKPYHQMLEYIFIRDDLNVKTIEDLKGKVVAIPSGYYNLSVARQDYPELQILETRNLQTAIESVVEKKADLLFESFAVVSHLLKKNDITTIRPFKPLANAELRQLHMAVPKTHATLAVIIDKAINAIPNSKKQQIHNTWLRRQPLTGTNEIALSIEEQQWLDEHKIIRFAGDPNWLPYEAFDQEGHHIGIVADHLKIIEQKLGIKLNIIQTKTWVESVDKVKRGEIDVLSETSDSDLQSLLSFTEDYISSPIVVVMGNNEDYVENINQIKQRKVAVIKDYGYVSEIINKYPDLKLHYVDTIQEGLAAVATAKVDVFLATLAQASYHIAELGINNIRIVGKTEFTTKLAFGMSEEFAPLVPLFNRALHSISPSEKQAILDKWGKQKFTDRTDYKWLAKVIGALLLFMLIMFYWNRKLSKEMELRAEAEEQTQMLTDSIPIQIVVTSFEGQILSANPKALNDYKLDKNELYQFNILEFYANMRDRKDVITELKEHAKVEQKIIEMRQPNGEIYSMMVSVMPIKYLKKPALLSIAVNMTERLEMEAALKSAKSHAESATRAKSEFLANMSHEIRTPMNAILGFTELLDEQVKDPKLKSFIKTIQSAGNNLLNLINDILDLSKIEAGKLRIEKTPCNPYDLFTELGNIFMLKMREKNIDFILNIDPAIPQGLYLDAPRLRQVLFNLIGNAAKFTEDGFIRITVHTENQNTLNSKLDLIIDIEDNGIGIAENQQTVIFQEFEQSEGQNNIQYGGTGLGLSISKRLVEMMDGKLSLQSQLGVGSTFTIELTALDVTSLSIEPSVEPSTNRTRLQFNPATILIVDDVPDNRSLLLAHFEDTALQTVIAENGLEAVDLVKKHLAKQSPFDLILMDLRMPIMDGYQAASAIKSFSDTPIVALTASVMADDFERKKSDHFEGYLRKPVLRTDLINELCKFLTYTEQAPTNTPETPAMLTIEDKTILPKFLSASETLLPLYETSIKSNNLTDIEQFSEALSSLVQKHPISRVIKYSVQLEQAVESFDIAAIKRALNMYPELISQLKSLLEQ